MKDMRVESMELPVDVPDYLQGQDKEGKPQDSKSRRMEESKEEPVKPEKQVPQKPSTG